MNSRRRLFITGISGLLGLNGALHWRDRFETIGCYRSRPIAIGGVEAVALNLEDAAATQSLFQQTKPDLVLHTAALTDVNRCEIEPALAARLNIDVTRIVAAAARGVGAQLVHISTDHLFAGDRPFSDELTEPRPVNSYARTKLEAERVVQELDPHALIVRTNFIGWGTGTGGGFLDWLVRSLREGAPLRMYADVFVTPIGIIDLLDCLFDLVNRGTTGVVHVAGAERLSKYELGLKAAHVFGYPADRVERASIDSVPSIAARPRDMSLDTGRVSQLLGRPMPDADTCLQRLRRLQDDGWPDAIRAALLPVTRAIPDRLER